MNCRKSALIGCEASVAMLRKPDEVVEGSCRQGFNHTVELAAGSTTSKCLGSSTIAIGNISLERSLHVKRFNETLLSVGQICNQDKVVVFTKHKVVILNITKFSASEE